jgi:2-C-methyl-D-erythritol 4-phosphate cytidylyltransferase
MSGLEADDWILVHDAARPCLSKHDLTALLTGCENDEIGGILALPAADTVKRASKDESGAQRIAGTEDRTQLWLAQTPQMFRAGVLLKALERADSGVTDEAAAVEKLGLRPRLVAGSRQNLKVTYPEDLAIAEAILARRETGR